MSWNYSEKNTDWMRNWPDTSPSEVDLNDLPGADGRPHAVILWPAEYIRPFAGVLAPAYDRDRPLTGSRKRKYHAEFTEAERGAISRLHSKAWGWEMRTGYPQHIQMSGATFNLLRRAANFFASL